MEIEEEALEKLINKLVDKFDIKKKIAYRASILKAIEDNKVNDMNELIAGISLLTLQFIEDSNGYSIQ